LNYTRVLQLVDAQRVFDLVLDLHRASRGKPAPTTTAGSIGACRLARAGGQARRNPPSVIPSPGPKGRGAAFTGAASRRRRSNVLRRCAHAFPPSYPPQRWRTRPL